MNLIRYIQLNVNNHFWKSNITFLKLCFVSNLAFHLLLLIDNKTLLDENSIYPKRNIFFNI